MIALNFYNHERRKTLKWTTKIRENERNKLYCKKVDIKSRGRKQLKPRISL
jgi:hypothetical protein